MPGAPRSAVASSDFDVFFGGNATVLNHEARTASNGSKERFEAGIASGAATLKRPNSITDLAIPTMQQADPSDSHDTFHHALVSPETSNEAFA